MTVLTPIVAESLSHVAWRGETAISRDQFHADVAALLSCLPERQYMVNLCEDRYHFLVGLAAAMERRQVNLLLPSRTPDFIHRIRQQYPDMYCLVDRSFSIDNMPIVNIDTIKGTVPSADLALAYPPDQVLAMAFTSGSTGVPKPNIKTWECLTQVAALTRARLQLTGGNNGTVVATVPPQHMYGLETSIMLPLQSGWRMHAGRPFFPADVADVLASVPAPRILVTTPVHIRALVGELDVLPELQFILSATAPLSVELAAAAESKFNTLVYEIFGFTEVGSAASRRTVEGDTWDLFETILLEQRGTEYFLQTPYISESVPISDVITPLDDSHFRLRGRSVDMVNIAGKRASLGDLNIKLGEIEGIKDGVFFSPDEESEKVRRLMAFVVAPGKSAEEISAALRKVLDPAFVPRPIVMLDTLPRNETGKLPRERLLELVALYEKEKM